MDLGYDYFLFKFEKKADYKHVLEGGPWVIGGHYLTVRQWSPNLNPLTDSFSKLIAWIRLPCLPMEYYNPIALSKMGAAVGRVIKFDRNTEGAIRGKFARICVELDRTLPLVSTILVGKHKQSVTYEGIQLICFHCGKFGHRKDACPALSQVSPPPENNDQATPSQEVTEQPEPESQAGQLRAMDARSVQRRERKLFNVGRDFLINNLEPPFFLSYDILTHILEYMNDD